MNNLVRRTDGAIFKGRYIKVELSEDLSKEEKMARRAEQQRKQEVAKLLNDYTQILSEATSAAQVKPIDFIL